MASFEQFQEASFDLSNRSKNLDSKKSLEMVYPVSKNTPTETQRTKDFQKNCFEDIKSKWVGTRIEGVKSPINNPTECKTVGEKIDPNKVVQNPLYRKEQAANKAAENPRMNIGNKE